MTTVDRVIDRTIAKCVRELKIPPWKAAWALRKSIQEGAFDPPELSDEINRAESKKCIAYIDSKEW